VRIPLVFSLKIGGLQELFWVLDFSKEKKFCFLAWWFLAIQEQLVFLPILKRQISNISRFFWKSIFLHYFFDKKIDFEYIFNNL
jgi:hypothetical protein